MTIRTWRATGMAMASVSDPLAENTLAAAITAAERRWPNVTGEPAILLAERDDLEAARGIVGHDVREVTGLPDGWAIAWPLTAT
jgi:hypothetical protein